MAVTRRRDKSRGSILIVTCLSMTVIAGVAGLAVDAGRLYVAKNELRSFSESATLSAAMQLDGTVQGVERAKAAVAGPTVGSNKWDMATKTVSNTVVTFAKPSEKTPGKPDDATWSATPADPKLYRFARVVATVDVPMIFMKRGTSAVAQAATAGQILDEPLSEDGDVLRNRLREDTDPITPTYEAYIASAKGNGSRIVGIKKDGTAGAYFLSGLPVHSEYIGPWAEKGGRAVRLVQ